MRTMAAGKFKAQFFMGGEILGDIMSPTVAPEDYEAMK